jgi:N-acetyl-gamma-glutamyl-phosphate reductase
MSSKVRVAVAGGTGYTGVELLRLLFLHPDVDVRRITSEQYAGKPLEEVYPSFRGRGGVRLEPLTTDGIGAGVDLVFSCLPHGTAAKTVAAAFRDGKRVLDLSADFRLKDAAVFRRWYGEHPVPELLAEAVYGIPEFSRSRLRTAKIVAVPGCYPTGALFGLVPLARARVLADAAIIVDSKSGASGAGRSAKTELLFCEVDESVRAYGVGKHRHQPEIVQELAAAGVRAELVFTPHILPIRRGILSTIYAPLQPGVDVEAVFRDAYSAEPFVQLLGDGVFPDVRDVRGTNQVHIGWTVLDSGRAVVVTAIDNLGKGAASQAVQCMNAMLGLDERIGLDAIAAVP